MSEFYYLQWSFHDIVNQKTEQVKFVNRVDKFLKEKIELIDIVQLPIN
jgi:hypothetical protein